MKIVLTLTAILVLTAIVAADHQLGGGGVPPAVVLPNPGALPNLETLKRDLLRCAGRFICDVDPSATPMVQCIDPEQTCDGTPNCRNGQDENSTTCTTVDRAMGCLNRNLSPCGDGSCAKICDGIRQCMVGDDERNCPYGCNCGPHEYSCMAGEMCLDKCQVCNGISECPGGDDEFNCPPQACPPGFYRCSDDGTCVLRSQVCDGVAHCPMHDDETGCPDVGCNFGYYRCNDGVTCVHPGNMCNGVQDCPGNDDEEGCTDCPTNRYKCSDGKCIRLNFICDGEPDCVNAEDEQDCAPGCYCSPGQYICMSGNCVDYDELCDSTPDCQDGEDERIIKDDGDPSCHIP